MRAHLRQVDWTTVGIDLATAAFFAAVGTWIGLDADGYARILSGGAIGYTLLLLVGCVHELARPSGIDPDGEIQSYRDEINRLHDKVTELGRREVEIFADKVTAEQHAKDLDEINTRLDNENAELSGENDRLQQKVDEFEAAAA